MKVTIGKPGTCGITTIPAGEYIVTLASDRSEMILSGAGKSLKIPAARRRAKARAKFDSISFYCGGGQMWSLVFLSPKYGEWISMIELKKDE